jgi:hypothetical protein
MMISVFHSLVSEWLGVTSAGLVKYGSSYILSQCAECILLAQCELSGCFVDRPRESLFCLSMFIWPLLAGLSLCLHWCYSVSLSLLLRTRFNVTSTLVYKCV